MLRIGKMFVCVSGFIMIDSFNAKYLSCPVVSRIKSADACEIQGKTIMVDAASKADFIFKY